MEAALEVVGDLGDVGNVDVLVVLVVVAGEVEVDLLAEEVLQEEVHQLAVFLLLEVVVAEHRDRPADHHLSVGLGVVVDRADGSVAGVGQGSRGQNGVGRVLDCQGGSVDVDEVDSCAFGLLLVLFLLLVVAAEHEGVVLPALGLLGVPVDDSGDFFGEDPVVDVGLLGVEVFVKGSADHAVRVNHHSELFGHLAQVGVVPGSGIAYFRSPPSWERTRRLPPLSTYFLRSSTSEGAKRSLGAARTKRWAFLILSKSMESLLSPIWVRREYLVGLLVFFDELFEVGAGVADLLLAGVEDDLRGARVTTFWEAIV